MQSQIYVSKVNKMICDYCAQIPVDVYLFGSRAREDARELSDIDVAFVPMESLDPYWLIHLKGLVEESSIPLKIDLIDLSKTSETFKNKVLSEAISWKEWNKSDNTLKKH